MRDFVGVCVLFCFTFGCICCYGKAANVVNINFDGLVPPNKCCCEPKPSPPRETPKWLNWRGVGTTNSRNALYEEKISPQTVDQLKELFTFEYPLGPDYDALPPIAGPTTTGDKYLYLTTNSFLQSINRFTGELFWQVNLTNLFDPAPAAPDNEIVERYRLISRSSPTIDEELDAVYITLSLAPTAGMAAFDRFTGELLWRTVLDVHPFSMATAQPMLYKDRILFGVSSLENVVVLEELDFVGSTGAVDRLTGEILFQFFTVPPGKYVNVSGCSVWGSGFPIDEERGVYYVGTGNAYSYSDEMYECQAKKNSGDPDFQGVECIPEDINHDSILAIDLETGELKWSFRALEYDAWTLFCLFDTSGIPFRVCPDVPGPDFDFPQAPMIFQAEEDQTILLVGQKSGDFWGLDAETGEPLWNQLFENTGSINGAMLFGSAFDGERAYTLNTNFVGANYTLLSGEVIDSSFLVALDPYTGAKLWETPRGLSQAAVSFANGVLFSCSLGGELVAVRATTGKQLWSLQLPDVCRTGPSIVDGIVYWQLAHSMIALTL